MTATAIDVVRAITDLVRDQPTPGPQGRADLDFLMSRVRDDGGDSTAGQLQHALTPRQRINGVTVPGIAGSWSPDAAAALLCARAARAGDDEPRLSMLCVAASALAVGATYEGSIGDVLRATMLGRRVADVLRTALHDPLRAHGWDPVGVTGRIAATAAAAAVLRLNAPAAAHAMGLAATGAGGLGGTHGGRCLLAARSALDAVQAARLAQAGFTSAHDFLGGRRGLVALMTSGVDPALWGRAADSLAAAEPHSAKTSYPDHDAPARTLLT